MTFTAKNDSATLTVTTGGKGPLRPGRVVQGTQLSNINRRKFLKAGGMIGTAGVVGAGTLAATAEPAAALPSDWARWIQQRVDRDGEEVVLPDDFTTRYNPIRLRRPVRIKSNTAIVGAGKGVVTVRPHRSYNPNHGPMFQTQSTSGDGEHHFRLDGFTIDGENRVEGVRLHGFLYTVNDLEIKNCDGHGFVSTSFLGEPAGPFVENEAIITNLDVILCGNGSKEPMVFDGPHDTKMARVRIGTQDWTGPLRPAALSIGTNGHGTTIDMLHFWGRAHQKGLVLVAGVTGCRFSNIFAEGAREEQVYMEGSNQNSAINGRVQGFPDFAPNAQGIKIRGASNSGHLIEVQTINCQGGGIVFEQDGAALSILNVTSWNSPLVGIPHATTKISRTAAGE